MCATACVPCTHLGGAHTVKPSNARWELMGTRLRTTEAEKRCSLRSNYVQLIEPDTMDMVSTDHAVGLMVADLRGCSGPLGPSAGDPRGFGKKRDVRTIVGKKRDVYTLIAPQARCFGGW